MAFVACAPVSRVVTPNKTFQVTNPTPPAGVSLAQACTPTGPELCFNAIDDNCNGVIDEGCGLQTGLLQFTIAWSAAAADVNLVLIAPDGERVRGDHARSLPNGFHLDRACPDEESCGGQNVENIFFDGTEPPHGHYTVEIVLVDLHGADAPIQVHFGARLVDRTTGFDAALTPGDDSKKTFSFDVP